MERKKNVGSLLALYSTPVAVIGAMNGEKPKWTLMANTGIIGHDRVLVSLVKQRFSGRVILPLFQLLKQVFSI